MNNCPCGSGIPYANCCEPIITNLRPATTAEALMRARYAAHVNVAIDFVMDSTHPEHREGLDPKTTEEWSKNSTWLGLEILSTTQGQEADSNGEVEFVARFRDKDEIRAHHERASFQRVKGNWYFTEGTMVRPQPLVASKTGRNDPCPCGSGSKYKKCCGK